MAERPRKLKLRLSLHVNPRLADIWRWNADKYGDAHATEYVDFLKRRTRELETYYALGREVPTRPAYRYMTFKTRASGHAYVVVYQVLESEIYVFDYFHTAQDWQACLAEELE